MAKLFQFAIGADFTKTEQQIRQMRHGVENLDAFHAKVGQYLVNAIRNRIYTTKTDPEGVRWAKNTELTVRLKGSSSVLYQTGALASSISYGATARGATVVADADYATFVQSGRKRTRGRYRSDDPVPARAFMGISTANRTRIAKMLRDHLVDNTRPDTPVGIGAIFSRTSRF